MKNPDLYIQYTDFGYIEDDKPKGITFGTCLIFAMIIVMLFSIFAFSAVCKNTYDNLIDMEGNIAREFLNIQNAMQKGRIENIPDVIKMADTSTVQILESIYADILASNNAIEDAKSPEELDNANAKLERNIERFLAAVEKNHDIFESEAYRRLINSIESVNERILALRENYNVAVREYNQTVENFPGTVLMDFFDFETMEEFESDRKIR